MADRENTAVNDLIARVGGGPVEPNRMLSYSWGAMGLESIVTWTLSPSSTGTHLRMEQSGFRTDQEQAFQGAKFGWKKFFGQLEQVLARAD